MIFEPTNCTMYFLQNWQFTLSVVKLTVSDCLPVKDAMHYLLNYVDCSGLFISFWFEIIFLFSY